MTFFLMLSTREDILKNILTSFVRTSKVNWVQNSQWGPKQMDLTDFYCMDKNTGKTFF